MTNLIWFVLLPFSIGELAAISLSLRIILLVLAIMFLITYRHRVEPHLSELLFCAVSYAMGMLL